MPPPHTHTHTHPTQTPLDLLLLAVSGDGGVRVVRRPAAVPGAPDGRGGRDRLPQLQHLSHPLEGDRGIAHFMFRFNIYLTRWKETYSSLHLSFQYLPHPLEGDRASWQYT